MMEDPIVATLFIMSSDQIVRDIMRRVCVWYREHVVEEDTARFRDLLDSMTT